MKERTGLNRRQSADATVGCKDAACRGGRRQREGIKSKSKIKMSCGGLLTGGFVGRGGGAA
jgi:hypothetical protein